MNHAHIDNSPRLQRVDAFLADGRWHSTRDIVMGADVCAVNSCICELRANGREIETKRVMDRWYYRRTDGIKQRELFAA